MFEEQVSEESYLDLNEEEDISMEDSREEHWRCVYGYGEDKSNIHALRWYLYTIYRDELIKR